MRLARPLTIGVVLLLMVNHAEAQRGVVVNGRIVELGGFGVESAVVALAGREVSTTLGGNFHFENVVTGAYTLRVEALGYAPREIALTVADDTTLLITLEPTPIQLDSLAVHARTITVRGHVAAKDTNEEMIHVEISTGTGELTRTDTRGWFRVQRFPAGPSEWIMVREMGYLPARVTLSAEADTTLEIELQPDSLARRMIATQVARLDARARPWRSPRYRPITREQLLWMRNATVLDVVRHWYGLGIDATPCIVVDEEQNFNGMESLTAIYPEEVERIEVVFRGGMILRIYTRSFIARMMAGGIELPRPIFAPGALRPMCR
jgi:Carboxypeptidase regulatory-like domain